MRNFHIAMLSIYRSQFVPNLVEGIKHVHIFVNFGISTTLVSIYGSLKFIFRHFLLQSTKDHYPVFFKESEAVQITETHRHSDS